MKFRMLVVMMLIAKVAPAFEPLEPGDVVFAQGRSVNSLSFDGTVTLLVTSGGATSSVTGIAVSGDSIYFSNASGNLITHTLHRIDAGTGAVTLEGPTYFSKRLAHMAVRGDGQIWVMVRNGVNWQMAIINPIHNGGTGDMVFTTGAISGRSQFQNYTYLLEHCRNGIDDDGDGLIDLADSGCTGPLDDLETEFPEDPDDPQPPVPTACSNGVDDDGDGLVDMADPGCETSFSNLEDPLCHNGVDDDGDGLTDWPNDPGCLSGFSAGENPHCDDGVDNNGNGLVDLDDPGCQGYAASPSERGCGTQWWLGNIAAIPLLITRWRRRHQKVN